MTEEKKELSERIKLLLEKAGVKQRHLAKKLNLSPSGMHYLINSNKISDKTLLLIKELNANEDWVKSGDGSPFITMEEQVYSIGVYYKDQLLMQSISPDTESEPSSTVVTLNKYTNPFAMLISNNNYTPYFKISDRIICEAYQDKPLKNDIALAMNIKANDIEIIKVSNNKFYELTTKKELSQSNYRIIGIVKELLRVKIDDET
jgi:transcriptional regulator with XRE-family HTH domain